MSLGQVNSGSESLLRQRSSPSSSSSSFSARKNRSLAPGRKTRFQKYISLDDADRAILFPRYCKNSNKKTRSFEGKYSTVPTTEAYSTALDEYCLKQRRNEQIRNAVSLSEGESYVETSTRNYDDDDEEARDPGENSAENFGENSGENFFAVPWIRRGEADRCFLPVAEYTDSQVIKTISENVGCHLATEYHLVDVTQPEVTSAKVAKTANKNEHEGRPQSGPFLQERDDKGAADLGEGNEGGGVLRLRMRQCAHCCRSFIAFLFSTVGLTCIMVGYVVLGGLIFRTLEAPNEVRLQDEMRKSRQLHIDRLWKATEQMNVLEPDNWTRTAEGILEQYTTAVYQFAKKGGLEGKSQDDELQWSFAGALLYSITVVTTIGKSRDDQGLTRRFTGSGVARIF